MNRTRALRIAGTAGGFFLRHGVASGVTVVVACVAWTVLYFLLLL